MGLVKYKIVDVSDLGHLTSVLNVEFEIIFQSRFELIKLTFFLNVKSNFEFSILRSEIINELKILSSKNRFTLPICSFIAQNPVSGSYALIEFTLINKDHIIEEITTNECEGINYSKIKTTIGQYLYTSTSCIDPIQYSTPILTVFKTIDSSFKTLSKLLLKEKFSFKDVIRQWTYIEKVIDLEESENGLKQFYQVFNDVRSYYFQNISFTNGYMAATGIGSSAGIISTELIVLFPDPDKKITVIPISNPRQINSFKYSQVKLFGTSVYNLIEKATPKFERAKLVISDLFVQLYISGTASVVGEETKHAGSAENQTKVTLENLCLLIKETNKHIENKTNHLSKSDIIQARVYIKDIKDSSTIKNICNDFFETVSIVYIIANICREDLLVEIEAYVERKLKKF